ncbi:MAG: hypothetical protein ACLRNA_10345 [Gemmiger formicilis]|uniref:hypothetical protein n=1 Tax=Gemmiger formicilis TaxID=745368 RepID=UPI003A1A19E9
MIATGAVALLGYTTTMPQPDPSTGHLLDDHGTQVRSAYHRLDHAGCHAQRP